MPGNRRTIFITDRHGVEMKRKSFVVHFVMHIENAFLRSLANLDALCKWPHRAHRTQIPQLFLFFFSSFSFIRLQFIYHPVSITNATRYSQSLESRTCSVAVPVCVCLVHGATVAMDQLL